MTTTTGALATAAGLASDIATRAAAGIAPGVPLNVGAPTPMPVELPSSHAVLAALGGAVSGEFALFVDADFARSLAESEVGELDLADALQPTLAAIAASLGSILVGEATTVDGRVALSRIENHPDAVVVGLDDGTQIRAAVAVGLDPAAAAPRTPANPGPVAGAAERLDLLRGVEMSATVELGRARMTINDLLSLRDGAIVELDRAAGDAADLFVNGRLIARGEIVVVDENYGLRVTHIVTDEQGR